MGSLMLSGGVNVLGGCCGTTPPTSQPWQRCWPKNRPWNEAEARSSLVTRAHTSRNPRPGQSERNKRSPSMLKPIIGAAGMLSGASISNQFARGASCAAAVRPMPLSTIVPTMIVIPSSRALEIHRRAPTNPLALSSLTLTPSATPPMRQGRLRSAKIRQRPAEDLDALNTRPPALSKRRLLATGCSTNEIPRGVSVRGFGCFCGGPAFIGVRPEVNRQFAGDSYTILVPGEISAAAL